MGIILAPFLLIAIFFVVISIILTIAAASKKQLGIKDAGFGLLISAGILGALVAGYRFRESVWALEPYFVFPFFMVYIPFFIGMLLKIIGLSARKPNGFSSVMLASVVFSSILFFAFYGFTFGIIDTFGLQRQY